MSYLLRRKSEAVLRISGARHTLCMPPRPRNHYLYPIAGCSSESKLMPRKGAYLYLKFFACHFTIFFMLINPRCGNKKHPFCIVTP